MASNMLSEKGGQVNDSFLPPLSSEEKAKSIGRLVEFMENGEWFSNNREDIRAKHGDMFVAVHGRTVVMADMDLGKLSDRVTAKYGQDSATFVEFVPKEDVILVV